MFDLTNIESEVLPQGYVNVVAVLNPFSDDHRASAKIPAGLTISEIFSLFVEDVGPEVEHEMSAFVDGDYIPPAWWDKVRPKADSTVFLKAVPGATAILGVLAPIAGQFVATTFFTGALTQSLVAAAVSFGVLAIGQALFGPSEPDPLPERRESFSITGSRNRAAPFSSVPTVLGTHRFTPPYGGLPYTRVFGNDQYLHFLVVWGYGPVSVSDVKIGNTPIGNFQGLQVWNDFDGTQTEVPLYPADAFQEQLNSELGTTPTVRRTPIDTTQIEIAVTAPDGLFTTYKAELQDNAPVFLTAQYRKVGDSTWTTFVNTRLPSPTVDLLRLPYAVNVPSGQYDVRLFRTAPIPDNPDPNVTIQQDVFWTALRAYNFNAEPVELAGIAKSAYIIKATDQLNGIVDQLNGIVSTKVPVWNGSTWTGSQASSNPAAIFRHVLTSSASPRPVPAANIDDDYLGEWYEYCEEKGYKYDAVIDSRISMRDLLKDIASAGFAAPTYIDDKWTVIIDRPRDTIIQHFTPRNTRNFQGALLYPEIPEALRIRFTNAERGYVEDERVVYDEGFDSSNAELFQVIDLPGQVDPDNVYRLGRHFLAAQRLRPEVFTFEVDVEHLVATRGDLCRLTHDAAIIGQASGRITQVSGSTIHLDQEIDLVSGTSYTIRIRDNTGDSNTFTFTANSTETVTSLGIGSVADFVSAGDIFMFGLSNNESFEVIISDIEYLDDLAARLTCVPYSEAVYNAAEVIPDYESNLSDPRAASFVGPPEPEIDQIITNEAALFRSATGDLQPRALVYAVPGAPQTIGNAYTTPTAFFQVRYRKSGTTDPYVYTASIPADTPFIELKPVEAANSYDIEVRAIDATGGVSDWTIESSVFIVAGSTPPQDVRNFGINVVGGNANLSWEAVNVIDLSHYEIRFSPVTSGAIWSQSVVLVERVARPATSVTVPARDGTYLIKAVDKFGNKSTDATENVVLLNLDDILGLNLVETKQEDPDFTGSKNDVVLLEDDTGTPYITLNTSTLFDSVDGDFDDAQGFFDGGGGNVAIQGEYDFADVLDLGKKYSVYLTTNITFEHLDYVNVFDSAIGLFDERFGLFDGDPTSIDNSNAAIQVSYTDDDPSGSPIWSDWQNLVAGNFSARAFRFRAVLSSFDGTIAPKVTELSATTDMPDRIESEEDITFTGTTNVTYPKAFYTTSNPAIGVALTGLATGDYYEITSKDNSGFTITVYDNTDTVKATSTQLDYVARGFGKEIA